METSKCHYTNALNRQAIQLEEELKCIGLWKKGRYFLRCYISNMTSVFSDIRQYFCVCLEGLLYASMGVYVVVCAAVEVTD